MLGPYKVVHQQGSMDMIRHDNEGVCRDCGEVFRNRQPAPQDDLPDSRILEMRLAFERADGNKVHTGRTVVIAWKTNRLSRPASLRHRLQQRALGVLGAGFGGEAQVLVGAGGSFTAAGGALEEAELQQVGLVYVHHRVGLF